MAYATTNPPRMMTSAVGKGPSWWSYDSADAATTVRGANYISDAEELGMAVGDIVIQSDSAGGTVAHMYNVLAVGAAGADLSDGVAIGAVNT